MKNLVLFLLLLALIVNKAHSQSVDISKLPDLEPYVGTWAGSNNKDSLVVILEKKEEYFNPLDINVDRLVGKFKYYKKGQLVNDNFGSKKYTLIIGELRNASTSEPSFLNFTFIDLKMNKRGKLALVFENPSQKVVTWKLRTGEGLFITEKRPENYTEFSIPKKMTLRKIK